MDDEFDCIFAATGMSIGKCPKCDSPIVFEFFSNPMACMWCQATASWENPPTDDEKEQNFPT
jgi:hypothetical protein